SDPRARSCPGTPGRDPALDGSVTSQSRHTVEVRVEAGEVGKTLIPHHSHDKGIPVQKTRLPGEIDGQGNQRDSNTEDTDTGGGDFVHGLPGPDQLLDLRRVAAQAIRDALNGPAEAVARFNGHDPVDDVAEDVARNACRDLLVLHPLEEGFTGS